MAELVEQDVKQLFKSWRTGDAASGQAMAQRFSDWYYAITAVRLGDVEGREPLERACQSFAKGIMTVTRTSELVDWAHGLVLSEVRAAGGRVAGGDFPNALTGHRSPVALLQQARTDLPGPQVELLALAFDSSVDIDTLSKAAEAQGGMPLSLLQARYELKRWLRDNADVHFTVVPDSPNLDRSPLPIYETARMTSGDEEAYFEKWLITDLDLCKDVAEFATFAHALRAGAFSDTPVRTAPSATPPGPALSSQADDLPTSRSRSGAPITVVIALFAIAFLGLVAASVAAFLLINN